MNFIKSRMNKDNFWNLMFWLGMTVGWSIAMLLSEQIPVLSGVLFWITTLVVPYIVTKASKVTFDKDIGFFNSEKKSLKDAYPRAFGLVVFLTIGLIALIGLIVDGLHLNIPIPVYTVLFISCFFLGPTLYFIYKNCPIAILFNKHAWKPMSDEELSAINRSPSFAEQRTDPACSTYPFNSHWKRVYKR